MRYVTLVVWVGAAALILYLAAHPHEDTLRQQVRQSLGAEWFDSLTPELQGIAIDNEYLRRHRGWWE